MRCFLPQFSTTTEIASHSEYEEESDSGLYVSSGMNDGANDSGEDGDKDMRKDENGDITRDAVQAEISPCATRRPEDAYQDDAGFTEDAHSHHLVRCLQHSLETNCEALLRHQHPRRQRGGG
jgi:hypothetical protein